MSLDTLLTEKVLIPKSEITAKIPIKANAKEYFPKPALPKNLDIATTNINDIRWVKISAIDRTPIFFKIVFDLDIL